MRILIVTATDLEMAPLTAKLRPVHRNALTGFLHMSEPGPRVKSYAHAGHVVDVLTTGVGMVATAVWCSHLLGRERYDLGLNMGVCGTFDRSIAPGTVVHVVTDRIAELGAEDGDAFLTVQELQLLGDDEFPFTHGRLVNAAPPANAAVSGLRPVDGITVNTAHGNEESIARVSQRFAPHVESMEGAAFMYVCLAHRLPFAQVRVVSNVVEKRNRAAWKMAEAVDALSDVALRILEQA